MTMASRSGICSMCGGGPGGAEHTPTCVSKQAGTKRHLERCGADVAGVLVNEATKQHIREFGTGADRSSLTNKIQYSRHIHPAVLHEFGEYMHRHRTRADGTVRESDNWQQGIPRDAYIDSLVRHVIDLWRLHYGGPVLTPETGKQANAIDLCCAIVFNGFGYMYELLVEVGGMRRGGGK